MSPRVVSFKSFSYAQWKKEKPLEITSLAPSTSLHLIVLPFGIAASHKELKKINPLLQVPLRSYSYSSSLHFCCLSSSLQLFSPYYVHRRHLSFSAQPETQSRDLVAVVDLPSWTDHWIFSNLHDSLILKLAKVTTFTVYKCLLYANLCIYVSIWLCVFKPSLWTYRHN